MFGQIEVFLLGLATVVDTVLLLVIAERINRPQVPAWLTLLGLGTWMLHAASFFHALLLGSDGSTVDEWDRLCRVIMAFALLMLPSAILHAALRLNQSGFDARAKFSWRYALLYLPLLITPYLVWTISTSEDPRFYRSVAPLVSGYLLWMVLANTASFALLVRLRGLVELPAVRQVLTQLAITLTALTVLVVLYVTAARDTVYEPWVRVMTSVSPSVAVTLLVWHTLRQRLMPLVVERTLIYGAFLVIVMLMHQQFIRPLTDMLERKSNLDFVILEFVVLIGLVLAWRPLRQRVLESTRYLLSNDIFNVRDKTRQLSLQLSRMALRPADEIRQWLEQAIAHDIGVDFAKVCLLHDGPDASTSDIQILSQAFSTREGAIIDRSAVSDKLLCQAMERLGAMLAFRLDFQSVQGIVLLGSRLRNDRLGEEALNALAMLFEQFAVTLHNRHIEQQRLSAERRAMQQEKLSVLGLIAGSLAHELRNPLSSIRTIATLLKEDLSPEDARHRDVSIIVTEIDRLSQTTGRLLDYAKPADSTRQCVEPDRVIARLLPILEQLARQFHVELRTNLCATGISVASTDAALSEILFNLIRNGIEAVRAQSGGVVTVHSQIAERMICITVIDNGPGIDPTIRDSLFQPFVSAKVDGTGLGLYVAAERVREMRGSLQCQSESSSGTEFIVRLPVIEPEPLALQ